MTIYNCIECGDPATLINITQFAGTHYWCERCVSEDDRDDCTPLAICRSPYCECPKNQCSQGYRDLRGTWPEHTDQLKHNLTQAIKTMNQQYLLDKLQEEAAEVIQAVSKIRRFGPNNHHPDRTETNLQELVGELEDFQAIVWALEEIKYLDPKPLTTNIIRKFNTLIGS